MSIPASAASSTGESVLPAASTFFQSSMALAPSLSMRLHIWVAMVSPAL